MTKAKRIEALERALAAIEAAISRVESALPAAATAADVKRLNAQLASLKSERFNINAQLTNLRAAVAATISPLNDADAKRLKDLSSELDQAIVDRAIVSATIDFAAAVLAKAKELKDGLA
jgi:predicted  nucleic acid-binding Zn-ribbon protein